MSIDSKMTAIADEIRSKTGGTESLNLDQMATSIPQVFDKGKESERIRFWEEEQKGGNRRNWTYFGAGAAFSGDNYNPIYEIIVGNDLGTNMFRTNTTITDTKVPIRFLGKATYVFTGCSSLVRVPLIELNANIVYTGWLKGCAELVEFIVTGVIGNDFTISDSKKLNRASLISIMNCRQFEDISTVLTITLSEEAVNREFETSEGANDGSTSVMWGALATASDWWTVSLI